MTSCPIQLKDEDPVAKQLQESIRKRLIQKYSEFLPEDSEDILPEYVKVLVCNKKTKEQIRGDLVSFLEEDGATTFCDWLWNHLSNLARSGDDVEKRRRAREKDKKVQERARKQAEEVNAPGERKHREKKGDKAERDEERKRKRDEREQRRVRPREEVAVVEEPLVIETRTRAPRPVRAPRPEADSVRTKAVETQPPEQAAPAATELPQLRPSVPQLPHLLFQPPVDDVPTSFTITMEGINPDDMPDDDTLDEAFQPQPPTEEVLPYPEEAEEWSAPPSFYWSRGGKGGKGRGSGRGRGSAFVGRGSAFAGRGFGKGKGGKGKGAPPAAFHSTWQKGSEASAPSHRVWVAGGASSTPTKAADSAVSSPAPASKWKALGVDKRLDMALPEDVGGGKKWASKNRTWVRPQL